MEDETKLAEGPEGTEPATTGTEPAAEGAGDGAGEPDYKALYERAVADSRKWERRSKANLAAARGAKKSVEDEVAELKAQLRRMEDERAHAELVSGVASAKGVPAELLHGDDEDELNASADALLAFARSMEPGTPRDKGGAPAGGARVTADQISKMKSPLARVQAYARMHAGQ